jgi:hypothetical protein
MIEMEKAKCEKCKDKAVYFHSRCCNAHFEGVITDFGEFIIVCEKCGKFCSKLNMEEEE